MYLYSSENLFETKGSSVSAEDDEDIVLALWLTESSIGC